MSGTIRAQPPSHRTKSASKMTLVMFLIAASRLVRRGRELSSCFSVVQAAVLCGIALGHGARAARWLIPCCYRCNSIDVWDCREAEPCAEDGA